MLPAAGRGIVAVTARASDHQILELLAALDDAPARTAATAERGVLRALNGSCRTPIGAYARVLSGDELLLTAMVARADGSFLLRRSLLGRAADAARLGAELGAALRADSPSDIFA
jgi:hydroxymethylbilane synthase